MTELIKYIRKDLIKENQFILSALNGLRRVVYCYIETGSLLDCFQRIYACHSEKALPNLSPPALSAITYTDGQVVQYRYCRQSKERRLNLRRRKVLSVLRINVL